MTRRIADKSSANGWRTVRFDEIAENIGDRVDPAESDAERYVGLEHLDSDSLKIRRWGTPDDVIGQKLAFRKGDIIFGRRRAYQRKLAVADFDGICSAHAMVVRAKEDAVEKEFLPFFMQSDMFMERAQEISVGSLSPTINWKTLRMQEFPLPPKDEQRRIAEILWAAAEVVERYRDAEARLEAVTDCWAIDFLTRDWPVAELSTLLEDLQYGSSTRASTEPNGGVPILGIPNVIGGRINLSDYRWVNLSEDERVKYRIRQGDVLIVRTNGNPDYVGRTAVVDDAPEGSVYASYLIRLRATRSELLPTFLHCALSSSFLRRTLRHEIRSSAGNYNLNTKGIKRQKIPLPPIDEQTRFSEEFARYQDRIDTLRAHTDTLLALKCTLTNAMLGVKT